MDENKDIIAITNEGVIIRTSVAEIPVYNRSATGVKVMKLDDECKIVKMSFTDSEKEEESDEADVNTDIIEGSEAEEAKDISTEGAVEGAEATEISDTPDGKTEE